MSTTQPTAQQVAFAIFASLPTEISYSGSDRFRVNYRGSLTPIDGDGGAPFATEIVINGKPFTLVVAASEDVNGTLKPVGTRFQETERSISFEIEPTD